MSEVEDSAIAPSNEGAYKQSGKSNSLQCWGRWWCIMLVIFFWLLAFGFAGAGGYFLYYNEKDRTKQDKLKHELSDINSKIEKFQKDIEILNQDLDTVKNNIHHEEVTYGGLKQEYDKEAKIYGKYAKEYTYIRNNITALSNERDKYHKDAIELTHKNNETTHKIATLTKDIEEAKILIPQYKSEVVVYKAAAVPIGLGFIGVAIDFFLNYRKLKALQESMNQYNHLSHMFDIAAEGSINAGVVSVLTKFDRVRKTCFRGFDKEQMKSCHGESPVIITVHTKDGYRFGAVLFDHFNTDNGAHKDSRAFTFSTWRGALTTITDPNNALKMSNEKYIQFGLNDIVIELSQVGTVSEASYSIPSPYTEYNFYRETNSFAVSEIEINILQKKI